MTHSLSLATHRYSIEPKTAKYVKGNGILSFARNLSNKYGTLLLDTATKTGLDVLKTVFKKAVHKAAEAKREFIRNKITDKTGGPKPVTDENTRNAEETIIPPEEKGNKY